MRFTFFKNTLFLIVLATFSCGSQSQEANERDEVIHDMIPLDSVGRKSNVNRAAAASGDIVLGADQLSEYIDRLHNKRVGIVANQTTVVNPEKGMTHLVDHLLKQQVNIKTVFAPEHGFRGTADAGEAVKDGIDKTTGLPIVSLYGDNKKPTKQQMTDLDIMIFDIQDVGARFYTYISTLHYVMEACAENNVPLIVLDRPNPNGHYIDGPVLDIAHRSFVGMHPVPVVHGMTIGEYALMINGEKWLKNKKECELTVIPMLNYDHNKTYSLPVKPSPNLPNDTAINLYPSLCFFEGTIVSAGRGTDMQFQIFGAPSLPAQSYPFTFVPRANEGAKHPKFKGEQCNGRDLRNIPRLNSIQLKWLIEAYNSHGNGFFNSFFTNLAGTKELQQQIEQGWSESRIKESWQADLSDYNRMRQPYLLYAK